MPRLARSIIAVAALATIASAAYDSFNIKRDHPICSHSPETCSSPVVLGKFYFTEDNGDLFLADNAYFIPGVASYRKSGTSKNIYNNADALIVKWMHKKAVSSERLHVADEFFSEAGAVLLRQESCKLPSGSSLAFFENGQESERLSNPSLYFSCWCFIPISSCI